MKNFIISVKAFRSSLLSFKLLQRILFYVAISLFGVTFFSITALSGRVFFNYVNIGIYIGLAAISILYVLLYGQFRIGAFGVLLFCFNVCTWISWLSNGCGTVSLSVLLVSGCSFLFYEFLCQDERCVRGGLFFCWIGGLVFLTYFIGVYWSQVISPDLSTANRIGTYFGNQNDTARFLCFAFLVFIYYAFNHRFYFSYLPALLSLYCIGLTGSISNLLSAFLVILVYLLLVLKKKGKIIVLISSLSLIVLFIVLLSFPAFSYFRTRLLGMLASLFGSSAGEDVSTTYRWKLAFEGFYLFLERPLFGYGFDGVLHNSFAGTFSHNNYADLAGNFGILALILFQILVLLPFVEIIKKHRTKSFISLICLYIFIFQVFLVSYYSKTEYFFLAFAYAENRFLSGRRVLTKKECLNISVYQLDI
jgi:O-antigen ligase